MPRVGGVAQPALASTRHSHRADNPEETGLLEKTRLTASTPSGRRRIAHACTIVRVFAFACVRDCSRSRSDEPESVFVFGIVRARRFACSGACSAMLEIAGIRMRVRVLDCSPSRFRTRVRVYISARVYISVRSRLAANGVFWYLRCPALYGTIRQQGDAKQKRPCGHVNKFRRSIAIRSLADGQYPTHLPSQSLGIKRWIQRGFQGPHLPFGTGSRNTPSAYVRR